MDPCPFDTRLDLSGKFIRGYPKPREFTHLHQPKESLQMKSIIKINFAWVRNSILF